MHLTLGELIQIRELTGPQSYKAERWCQWTWH